MKTKGSKLLTIEKAKNDAHLHKGTTARTTGLNKGLRKEGWKGIRKLGEPARSKGTTAS